MSSSAVPILNKNMSTPLMAHKLYIHPCIHDPPHRHHPPIASLPLRIRIQGPLEAIQKLLPNASWHEIEDFPQPGGVELARLTHQAIYGQQELTAAEDAIVMQDEYLAWVMVGRRPLDYIDYYGVTFDHLVPHDDPDPEVLMINIIELESTEGLYANGVEFAKEVLPFSIEPKDYIGKKVLAVPRCCQHKKGTLDRSLTNDQVASRKSETKQQSRKLPRVRPTAMS